MRSSLINFGNICFLNSVIQLIMSMDDLVIDLYKNNIYTDFIEQYKTSLEMSPIKIYTSYCSLKTSYRGGSQEDANECLGFFFDLFKQQKIDSSFSIIMDQHIIRLKEDINSLERSEIKSVVENMLLVKFSSSLKESIIDSFKEDNEDYVKKYRITTFPKYLCISVNRFIINFDNGIFHSYKIDDYMNVPIIINFDEKKYSLNGFILHNGTINNGHYIYCGFVDNRWMIFNDRFIFPISIGEMLEKSSRAYIYLYVKI